MFCFKYVHTIVVAKGKLLRLNCVMTELVRAVVERFKLIWKPNNMSTPTKIKILKNLVLAKQTNGSESRQSIWNDIPLAHIEDRVAIINI